jgi:hypothetical protein
MQPFLEMIDPQSAVIVAAGGAALMAIYRTELGWLWEKLRGLATSTSTAPGPLTDKSVTDDQAFAALQVLRRRAEEDACAAKQAACQAYLEAFWNRAASSE